jgi:hypothetical protein
MPEHKIDRSSHHHPWRKPLLFSEFSALAVLVSSMAILANQGDQEGGVSRAWLLVPAFASLVVFLSFLGLMYLRWVGEAGNTGQKRHQITLGLLALTLLGIWAYGIIRTWASLS